MRILKILSTLDPETGGPASVFSAAVISTAAAGAEIECLTLRPLDKDISKFPDYEIMAHRGIKIHALRHFDAVRFLIRSIRTFDVVHVDGCWQSLCVIALLISKLNGRSTAVSPHESLTREELRRTRSFVRLSIKRLLWLYYRLATDCIVYSSSLELRDSLKHPNAVVIPHPVFNDISPLDQTSVRPGLASAGRLQLGYLGRFHTKKRVEAIVSAAVQTGDTALIVAGTGPEQYTRTLRALAKPSGRVQWLGFVQKAQREDFFRRIDFLVLASEYECFGMSAAEALIRGIPVIVTERVGVADDVRRLQAGFVVDGSIESLSAAFEYCAKLQPAPYRELQHNALAARRLYSFSAHAAAQMRTYAALCARGSARPDRRSTATASRDR